MPNQNPTPAHNKLNLTGQRYGRLVVIQEAGRTTSRGVRWLCQCDCKKFKVVTSGNLRSGNTRSCGCGEQESRFQLTHGQSRSSMYRMWVGMLQRCYNPNSKVYRHYGARGITVDERWHTFEPLVAYILATIGERPPGRSIDRINNDGNYEPGNIRWATRSEQMKNRRKAKWRLRQSRVRAPKYFSRKNLDVED
jgi:hypothetical protein